MFMIDLRHYEFATGVFDGYRLPAPATRKLEARKGKVQAHRSATLSAQARRFPGCGIPSIVAISAA
jgi:hypothetical protein